MRARLAALTDAHVDTLLEHGALTEGAAAVLSEAQRIAEGLTDRQAASLAAVARRPGLDVILAASAAEDIVRRGLARRSESGLDGERLYPTPLGTLALALRERSR